MTKRFNPPPNWPPPPSVKWRPGPDWQPDPRWGPPPPGWELWVRTNPFARGLAIGFVTVAAITVVASLRFADTEVAAAYCAGGVFVAAPGVAFLGRISSFRWEWWFYAIAAGLLTPITGEWILMQSP